MSETPKQTNDLVDAVDNATEDQTTTDQDVNTQTDQNSDTSAENQTSDNDEISIDKLGLTEEQLEAVKKLKQKEIDAVNNHWQKTTSKQGEELGRLRKLENLLHDLDQQSNALKAEEVDNEYDVDKLADVKAKRLNIDQKKANVQQELLKAQTVQKVPDFEQLVNDGYIKDVVVEIGKAQGITDFSDGSVYEAIEAIRSNPSQALMIAHSARTKKQLAEVSNKNKQIVENTQNMGKKAATASEQTIVTNGNVQKPKYTTEQLWAMKPEELQRVIDEGRKKGLLNK